MPTLREIEQAVAQQRSTAQDTVRREYLQKLAEYTKRDTILYATAFSSGAKSAGIPPLALSITLEDMQGLMASMHGMKGKHLDLVIHSPGGSMEAADQMVQYLRAKYDHIRAVVPQNAMSAATMLACACDEIVMAKHSALGPIDPQATFPTPGGLFTAPAQSILDEFDQAKSAIASDPATAALWLTKIQAYPPGFLTICETTLELAREKVAAWLSSYMLKGAADPNLARAVADWLGNAKEHKTHGRPVGLELARTKGLKVAKLEDDQTLQDLVLSVFHATMVTFQVTNCVKLFEGHHGRGFYTSIQVQLVKGPAA
jgi:hypothetical protein